MAASSVSPPVDVAAPKDVLKPDHASARKHFIFTDEHEQLRESIRAFAKKELAPHADQWEKETFPNSVFTRMGELGFLGMALEAVDQVPDHRRIVHRQAELVAAGVASGH